MKNIAVITAGGSGKRLPGKTKKQFVTIAGRPLLFWTLDKFVFHSQIEEIVITLPEDEMLSYRRKIETEFPGKKIVTLAGGEERQFSVLNALRKCPADTDFVLIHDGVRPFVSKEEISKLLQIAAETKAVIPVGKMKNTIKKIANNKIVETVLREDLANAFTPQVFRFSLILSLHEKAAKDGLLFTDDAAILEHYGYEVAVYFSDSFNMKITEPTDLKIAEMILKNGISF